MNSPETLIVIVCSAGLIACAWRCRIAELDRRWAEADARSTHARIDR